MKQKLKFIPTALALTISFSVIPVSASDSNETIETISERLYWGTMELSPANLHFYQSDTNNLPISLDKPLGSFSEEQEELQLLLEDISSSLKSINFSSLDRHDRQVYLSIQDFISTNEQLLSLPDYASTLGPMGGLLSTIDTLATEYYLLSETDITNYFDLIRDIPRFLDDLLLEIDYQESIGYEPSAYAYACALDREDDLTVLEDHPYLNAFLSNIKECNLSAEEVDIYTSHFTDLLANTIIPAYTAFFDVLEEKCEDAPESRGLCEFEHGKEYYSALASAKTGTDMTPEELLAYLEQKIASDMGKMSRLYFMNPSAFEELESITLAWSDPNEMLEILKEKTLEYLPSIDNTDYVLSYLPESLEVENNLAYYVTPPSDLPTRNIIRVNGSEVGNDPLVLWTTLSHEGFPGHLYQSQYFLQNIHRYPVENILGSLGTSEGWAFYVERLALDWAGIDSDIADLFWYDTAVSMALTALIDIGVNYEGWSTDYLKSYLANYFGELDDEAIQELYDTAANDPGIYLPYAVGYYQLADLFDNIDQNYASEKEMYAAFLNHSNLPFTLLETYLGSDGSI